MVNLYGPGVLMSESLYHNMLIGFPNVRMEALREKLKDGGPCLNSHAGVECGLCDDVVHIK